MSGYGFDGDMTAEDWLDMGLDPSVLTEGDKKRLGVLRQPDGSWWWPSQDLPTSLHAPKGTTGLVLADYVIVRRRT